MKYTILSFAVISALIISGCNSSSSSRQRPVEQPIPVSAAQTPTPAPAAVVQKLVPPTAAEIQQAMQRVFGNLVTFSAQPQSFIVGDFNGDGSEDLAIVARPNEARVADINSEFANWIIQDAEQAMIPTGKQRVVRLENSKPVLPKIAAGEQVLAIIHGYGAAGWRNPDARQAYLVKHAAGLLEETEPSVSERAIRAMHLPVEGDIIKTMRGNRRGFVFWTGGMYAWHPKES